MSVTQISDILDMEEKRNVYMVNPDNLSKVIVDLDVDIEQRINALNMYFREYGLDETIEIINKLSMMYQMSGISLLKDYLYRICIDSDLDAFLKSISAKSLRMYNKDDDIGYKVIDLIFPKMGDDIGTPYKVEFLKLLMYNDNYRNQSLQHLCSLINNQNIECEYRYRVILSLEEKTQVGTEENKDIEKLTEEQVKFYMTESCIEFSFNKQNMTLYRILACQYLLQHGEISSEQRSDIEQILYSFANDNNLDYDLRADATDVLLQLGNKQSQTEAREIIMRLGRQERTVRTIYDNAQNVHTSGVEESVLQALEFLHTFNIMKKNGLEITFEYVEEQIKNLVAEERKIHGLEPKEKWEKEEKINVALNRIYLDRAIYSKYSCKLVDVLLRVWTYIIGHDSETEMKKRLLEELEEMSGTCSSGFITRLINTISGFGDFSIRISWREQIVANFSGRLSSRIRDLDNLALQDKILEEMTTESSDYKKRKHFLKFLRQNVLSIREELYEEFKKYIEDTEFDLYFRAAISMYETGNFQ